jgi:hypothetical protein
LIERYRPVAIPAPEPTPAPKPKPTPQPVPLRLNRNFMNYPLARDARVITHWRKSKKTGEFITRLPGEDRILLILPATTKALPVSPTGLDMAVLFALLAEVQQTESAQVSLSYAALLRRCGLTVQTLSRRTVRPALWLWSKLRLQIDCWHYPVKGKGRKVLPPPIVTYTTKGKVTVTLHDDWVKLALDEQYFQPVPLPLPVRATDQNAALMIMTSPIKWSEPDNEINPTVAYYVRGQSNFARKIGLSTKNRRARLESCLSNRVAAWMAQHDGELLVAYSGQGNIRRGSIGFIGIKPKAPPIKRIKPKTGYQRSVEGVTNVAVETPKRVTNVGGTMTPYEVRKDGKVDASLLEVKKASKKESMNSSHPIRRSVGFDFKKQNRRAELDEIAEARAGYTIWNYVHDNEEVTHSDPYADDM